MLLNHAGELCELQNRVIMSNKAMLLLSMVISFSSANFEFFLLEQLSILLFMRPIYCFNSAGLFIIFLYKQSLVKKDDKIFSLCLIDYVTYCSTNFSSCSEFKTQATYQKQCIRKLEILLHRV